MSWGGTPRALAAAAAAGGVCVAGAPWGRRRAGRPSAAAALCESFTVREGPCRWGLAEGSKLLENYGHNVGIPAEEVIFPATEAEAAALFEDARSRRRKVRIVGSASGQYGALYTCDDVLLSTRKLGRVLSFNKERETVTVEGGAVIGDVEAAVRERWGQQLAVDVDRAVGTVGGALGVGASCSGSGGAAGCLAATVRSFRLLTPGGEILDCSAEENADVFRAGRCHLGALGLVTRVELAVKPVETAMTERQQRTVGEELRTLRESILANAAFRVWLFPHTNFCVGWRTNRRAGRELRDGSVHERAAELALPVFSFLARKYKGLKPYVNELAATQWLGREARTASDRPLREALPQIPLRTLRLSFALPATNLPQFVTRANRFFNKNLHLKLDFPLEVKFQAGNDAYLCPANLSPPPPRCSDARKRSTVLARLAESPYAWLDPARPLAAAVAREGPEAAAALQKRAAREEGLEPVFAVVSAQFQLPFGLPPPKGYDKAFQGLLDVALDLSARPLWTNVAALDAATAGRLYADFDKWRRVRERCDPQGMLVRSRTVLETLSKLGLFRQNSQTISLEKQRGTRACISSH